MAPEQLAGDPAADHRIDIYAVGLLAYELLTGDQPFAGPSPAATMAAQLTRVPDPLYKICPDVPQPLSAVIMQCLAKDPKDRPQTASDLMAALDSISTASGGIKTSSVKTLPAVATRRRTMTIGAGVAVLALCSAVVVFASQRRARALEIAAIPPVPAAPTVAAAAGNAKAVAPKVPVAAPAKLALTRQDSLAIAEAVQKRLAKEEAVRGREEVAVIADSIAANVRKAAIDSILRVSLPKGMKIPVWSDFAPPVEWGGKRRVVVTEPRPIKNDNVNAFGSTLSEAIRKSLMKQKAKYSVVDPDSVSAVLAQSRVRTDVENALKPDVLISPVFVGPPTTDSMTVLVTIRDVRGTSAIRSGVASVKFAVADPERSIPELVQEVMSRLDEQARAPKFTFRTNGPNIRTIVQPKGRNDQQ